MEMIITSPFRVHNHKRQTCLPNKAVVELALAEPGWGQVRAANELKKQGIFLSPAGVRCVWLRHDLENIKKRLKAVERASRTG